MRSIDFSSWQALISTLLGLAVITLIGVGIRLIVMHTVQQRRERENRQINERLRTLIAAYRTLGGSFTGDLEVDPIHLRDLRRRAQQPADTQNTSAENAKAENDEDVAGSDRSRRIRDAVEAALSDIILLGTEEQVRLAARSATELAAGRPVPTAELVVSLRNFIRQVLDLEPVPAQLDIPKQGPARPAASRGGAKAESSRGDGGKQGGGKLGGGGAALGAGAGAGAGLGMSAEPESHDESAHR